MLTLVHGIETLAVAPSLLGDPSKATSPSFRREVRERTARSHNVVALTIKQNVSGRSVAETVKSFATLILFLA